MTKILSGTNIAIEIKTKIKTKIQNIKRKNGRIPKLVVIIVGNDCASELYVKHKVKACNDVGITTEVLKLESTITQTNIIDKLNKLNLDNNVDGILVQLPLPSNLNSLEVINTIAPCKDVDGLTNINAGRLLQGDSKAIVPCTVKGIIELLMYYQIAIKKQNITIINDSNIVGKPLSLLLNNLGATVTVAHKFTKNLKFYTKNADIICSATGVYNIIRVCDVKKGVTIIDIAMNHQGKDKKLVGDIDFAAMQNIAAAITPVPGGVGPMTIAMLLDNLLTIYEQNHTNKIIKYTNN